jgi:hypothetical protein
MRYTKFAFTVHWIPWLPGMDKDRDGNSRPEEIRSHDTICHNEAE